MRKQQGSVLKGGMPVAVNGYTDEFRTTLVCIDSYADGVPKGRFKNPSMKEEAHFESLMQFVRDFECSLEQMDFPKSYTTIRTFAPITGRSTGPPSDLEAGRMVTFAVRILFRQNSSWQGSVTWVEGKREQTFRSALELILLMGSVLDCPEALAEARIS